MFEFWDIIGLIVFYYCFGFVYDDEICVEILEIIIGGCNDIDLLSRVNFKGDIVLDIVVKYLNYSRI